MWLRKIDKWIKGEIKCEYISAAETSAVAKYLQRVDKEFFILLVEIVQMFMPCHHQFVAFYTGLNYTPYFNESNTTKTLCLQFKGFLKNFTRFVFFFLPLGNQISINKIFTAG